MVRIASSAATLSAGSHRNPSAIADLTMLGNTSSVKRFGIEVICFIFTVNHTFTQPVNQIFTLVENQCQG